MLQPAEIDAMECVDARLAQHERELEHHLEREVRRLESAARRAERQYDSVDPENRLIAATLEKRWESALADWEQSKGRLAELRVGIRSVSRSRQNCATPSLMLAAGCRICETGFPSSAKGFASHAGDGRESDS